MHYSTTKISNKNIGIGRTASCITPSWLQTFIVTLLCAQLFRIRVNMNALLDRFAVRATLMSDNGPTTSCAANDCASCGWKISASHRRAAVLCTPLKHWQTEERAAVCSAVQSLQPDAEVDCGVTDTERLTWHAITETHPPCRYARIAANLCAIACSPFLSHFPSINLLYSAEMNVMEVCLVSRVRQRGETAYTGSITLETTQCCGLGSMVCMRGP